MPTNTTQYNLLISCPGDIVSEREIVKEVVGRFNSLYSEYAGVSLFIKHWSTDAFPESGGRPQELLNAQLVDKCDAAIAIFWTRFGSPTGKYGSGTEEEIERMLQSGRQVFMYFSDKQLEPSKQDSKGYQEILAFRQKYTDRGIYWTFTSDDEFEKLLFAHLSKYFLGKAQVDAYRNQNHSDLRLLGIDEKDNLTENASLYRFVLNNLQSKEGYKAQITQQLCEISEMKVGKRAEPQYKSQYALDMLSGSGSVFSDPVSIKEDDRKIINEIAKIFGFSITEDFFDLGNLAQNALLRSVNSGESFIGTDAEINKYNKINALLDTIMEASKWAPIENAFQDKRCIRLALQNCGKAFDEDVEVTMSFPTDAIEPIYDIAQFDNGCMGYLLREQNIEDLFGIKSTADYLDYSASKPDQSGPNPIPMPIPMYNYTPDYSEAFLGELRDTFCYSIYSKGDQSVVKIKFNYIKHNTVIAFPTAIFLKNNVSSVSYKITSKNNPDVIEGTVIIT